MVDSSRIWKRMETSVGVLCLIATFLLLSTGVRTVRADADAAPIASTDPALLAAQSDSPPSPAARADAANPAAAAPAAQPLGEPLVGEPAREVAPGVIVLNTRGYNYGPPVGEVDPEALEHETVAR